MSSLIVNTPSAANIVAYAEIIHDRATLRNLINTASDIQENAFNPEGRNADEVLDNAERLIMQVAEQGPKSGSPVKVDSLVNGYGQ